MLNATTIVVGIQEHDMSPQRCGWSRSPLMIEYHDAEWGVPSYDDRHLFEHLTLEGAQAGLNWELVLKKRDGYRKAFAEYDLSQIAGFEEAAIENLVLDPGIIRNRLKIVSVVANARAGMAVQREFGSLSKYMWDLSGGKPRQNSWRADSEMPANTPDSARISKDMLKRGFKFVGPTGIYAFMQAVGMVNDHILPCFRHAEVAGLAIKALRDRPARSTPRPDARSRPVHRDERA